MKRTDLYSNAHLIVAAIRVLEHQNAAPPSIDDLCKALSYSLERGNLMCKKLKDLGIIDIIEGAFGIKLIIKNHLLIEDISKELKESSLADDLKKFQDSRKDITKKIESLKAEQVEKKKSLFADIERQLKKGIEKNNAK